MTDPVPEGSDPLSDPAQPAGLRIEWYNTMHGNTPRFVSVDTAAAENPNPESPTPAPRVHVRPRTCTPCGGTAKRMPKIHWGGRKQQHSDHSCSCAHQSLLHRLLDLFRQAGNTTKAIIYGILIASLIVVIFC